MKNQFDSLNVSAAAAILIHRMSYAVKWNTWKKYNKCYM
jgi:hypothetical protein